MWAFEPQVGGVHFAAWIGSTQEFDAIVEQGYVTLNGQYADVVDRDDPNLCDRSSGFVRFQLREPLRPRLELVRCELEQTYMEATPCAVSF